MPWSQIYNPLNNPFLSVLVALFPAIVLLVCLGVLRLKAHLAALAGLATALLVAVLIYGMPADKAAASAVYGFAYGLMPIGWIILNVIFLYRLVDQKGQFKVLQGSLTSITQDRRLQLLLVAFCFGAFLEGAAGFGAPVAVTASILIGLGFPPLAASGLSLIANTAPVPFAGLGTPLMALQSVTGLSLGALTTMVARQMTLFDLLIPFWLVWVFAGRKGMWEVWPALLVAGGTFAISQLAVASLHGPWLVNIISSLLSMGVLMLFLKWWQPAHIWRMEGERAVENQSSTHYTAGEVLRAWFPWLLLSGLVFIWGIPQVTGWMNSLSLVHIEVPGLHLLVQRMPPVVPQPHTENAIFDFAWLSANGTAILLAALISGLWLGYSPLEMIKQYGAAFRQVGFALLTIAAMMAIGFVIRYAGMDGTLGMAFATTGMLYPFFGTLLGWVGVVITGSDTSSNVLFGSLQRITAEQLGLSPVLMAAANSSGGVMGKMINAQSIVVAATATRWLGHESDILRKVFFHSLVLTALVALLVLLMAYVPPFTWLVVK